jgi:HipA-like kinase
VKLLVARRAIEGGRRGSSRPIVVETDAGPCLVKLRGAAQGTGPLVAEIIVGAIAEALGLAVPARYLVSLSADIDVPERDAELRDLMAASIGVNLGFAYLAGARDLTPAEIDDVNADDRAAILWLDRFVMNPDRTTRNTNLLWWEHRLWLIDHGAALGFQYDWSAVSEASTRSQSVEFEPHLFAAAVSPDELREWDSVFASRLTRDALEAAVADVPDTFLLPLLTTGGDSGNVETALIRRRAAYVAFLWKRLKAPRSFADLDVALVKRTVRVGPPEWLTRRSTR